MIHVVQHEPSEPSTPIQYGIQWKIPTEFDQGDSLSLSDTTTSVKELIERFENQTQKSNEKKFTKKSFEQNENEPDRRRFRSNMTDSDLTSLDSQTIKLDLNQNRFPFSHHSSISNFDITIPSNLSSSIDLEQFECFSTTSNLSECLRQTEEKSLK